MQDTFDIDVAAGSKYKTIFFEILMSWLPQRSPGPSALPGTPFLFRNV